MNRNIIIIPTYNEKDNIRKLIEEILSCSKDLDILIVDDNSPDGTSQEADSLSRLYKEVKVLHRPAKLGIGKAYIEGFKWALTYNYEHICEMDADFSHNPRDIPRLLSAIGECDLCIGSRYIKWGDVVNWAFWRQALSRLANFYIRFVTRLPVKDGTAGFKCFKRRVLESMPLLEINSEGYSFQVEMNYRTWAKGFGIKEIPIVFTDRRQGRSKMSKKDVFEAFLLVWRLPFIKE
ncbi:MAG: polyprenol monophosphomannose synthase [Candidatus Omnitrophota bacterium]